MQRILGVVIGVMLFSSSVFGQQAPPQRPKMPGVSQVAPHDTSAKTGTARRLVMAP
jgi:hypothetical protein